MEVRKRKRSRLQREEDLLFIEREHLQCRKTAKITELLNARRAGQYSLTNGQIEKDLAEIVARWRAAPKPNNDEERARAIKKIDRLEEEAWEAYDRAQEGHTETSVVKVGDGTGGTGATRSSVKKKTREPGAAFMVIIERCQERRAKLLGLDAPIRLENTGKDGAPIEVNVQAKVVYLPAITPGGQ